MRPKSWLFVLLFFAIAVPAFADEAPKGPTPVSAPASAAAIAEPCEHGVKKALCTRCNPKLAAVFKAKSDWCGEHERPESQCAICHPELAKAGVKP
jgi:hypothetical protein